MADPKKSLEYLAGPNGALVGPGVDDLSDDERGVIQDCVDFFSANAERMAHFARRVAELGRTGADTVITLIDVDDPSGDGQVLADLLMPGTDWQQYRDRGETPVARGLAERVPVAGVLAELGYAVAADELRSTEDLRVVVLRAETVQVMDAQFA